MGTSVQIFVEGVRRSLGAVNTQWMGLIAPGNDGAARVQPNDVWVYGDPASNEIEPGDVSEAKFWAQGGPVHQDEQVQTQPAGGGPTYAHSFLGSVPPAGAMCWLGDVGNGEGSGPTVGGFASAIPTPPAIASNVTVSMVDATPFGALDDQEPIFCDGLVYLLQKTDPATSFAVPGALVLQNTGVKACRVMSFG